MSHDHPLDEALRQRADTVQDTSLTFDAVRGRARGIRRRRMATATVSAVAAVALAIGGPVLLLGGGEDRSAPPPTATRTATSPEVAIDLDALPEGEPARVPVAVDGQVRFPDGTEFADTRDTIGDLVEAYPYGDGYLASVEMGDGTLFNLDAAGVPVGDAVRGSHSIAYRPGSAELAWVTSDAQGGNAELHVGANGTERWSVPLDVAPYLDSEITSASPVGFIGDRVLVNAGSVDARLLLVSEDGTTEVPDVTAQASDDVHDVVVATTNSNGTTLFCEGVVSVVSGEALWDTCDYDLESFSPDGARVFAVSEETGTGGHVLDAQTGEPVIELVGTQDADPSFTGAVWESADTLLVEVVQTGEDGAPTYGLVRVDVSNRTVERVAPILPYAGSDYSAQRYRVLPAP